MTSSWFFVPQLRQNYVCDNALCVGGVKTDSQYDCSRSSLLVTNKVNVLRLDFKAVSGPPVLKKEMNAFKKTRWWRRLCSKVSNCAGVYRLEHNYIVRYIKISQLYCQIYKNIFQLHVSALMAIIRLDTKLDEKSTYNMVHDIHTYVCIFLYIWQYSCVQDGIPQHNYLPLSRVFFTI